MAASDNPGEEIGLVAGEKKRPIILLVIVGLLVLLLVGAAVGVFVIRKQLQDVTTGGGEVVEQRVKRIETKGIISLEQFMVNLADIGGTRFLRATFQLGMAEELKIPLDKDSKEIVTIRDGIISLLCSKSSDDIASTEGKEALREEIRVIVNERYPQNRVAEVFITEFIVSN